MAKTLLSFELPMMGNRFSLVKVDNSASSDALMPSTKSPNLEYICYKNDGSTQNVDLFYDKSDGYKKKFSVNGYTTVLDDLGADDAVTDVVLLGDVNPLTFIFSVENGQVGYIRNPLDDTVVAVGASGAGGSGVIADSTNFENIYGDLTGLPAPVNLKILFKTPNPLTGSGYGSKSFTIDCNPDGKYLNFTNVRADNTSFGVAFQLLENSYDMNGITYEYSVSFTNAGSTISYHATANFMIALTQISGYDYDSVAGTYTENGNPEPISLNNGVYNPNYDGLRVILVTDLNELNIGGVDISISPVDSGFVVTESMSRHNANIKASKANARRTHRACDKMLLPNLPFKKVRI